MRFTKAGQIEVEIVDATIAEPHWDNAPEGAFDVALKVRDAENHEDWWRGEVSGAYGKGNFSDKTQAEITMLTLKNIGWKNLTRFDLIRELVGVKTTAMIKESKKDDKIFYNVSYLGGGGSEEPKALSPDQILARAARFFPEAAAGAGAATTATQTATAAPATEQKPAAPAAGGFNPFGA